MIMRLINEDIASAFSNQQFTVTRIRNTRDGVEFRFKEVGGWFNPEFFEVIG